MQRVDHALLLHLGHLVEQRKSEQPAGEQRTAEKPLSKFHHSRTNRLRTSQNGALLLLELGAVDIRRVGTQNQSEYSSRGVPS